MFISAYRYSFLYLRHFFISCLFLSTLACSSGLVYQNLDWVIPWYVDDYVELSEQQQAEFDLVLEQALVWHKTQELPRYRHYLQTVQAKLDRPLSEGDVQDLQTFLSGAFKTLQKEIVPKVLPLAKNLTKEQQARFWREMNKKQTEYEEEFLSRSEDEYREDLNEKYTQFLARFLGTLTETQDLIVEAKVKEIIRADDIWIKARRAWLDEVRVQYESDAPNWQQRMEQAWLNREQHYSVEERRITENRDQQARQLLLAIINSRTEEQGRHFNHFLDDWQAKFDRWQR